MSQRLGMAASTVYRIESGHTRPQSRTMRDLLDLYQVGGGEREALLGLAREAARRGWWHAYDDVLPGPYVGLEAEAASVWNYEPLLVPGLLETEAYARAVVSAALVQDPAEIERRIAVRMERQRRLAGPDAIAYWAVVDEAALRRPVGGPAVMAEQLRRLQEVAVQPNVTLQVLPFDAGAYLGMGTPLAVLAFPRSGGPRRGLPGEHGRRALPGRPRRGPRVRPGLRSSSCRRARPGEVHREGHFCREGDVRTMRGTEPAVTADGAVWRKATRSNTVGNQCVEVALLRGGIAVRDSKDPEGPRLMFSPGEWEAFIDGVKGGEFDLS
ncbi:Scr1 family TA system antitoxin-like transcriptional regulator [Microbispora sp. ATCC PTA-5024]|nr:Scr1 family TA system antitoxin-like transcriptional regulator [Microbispora sp. ATCC PTA-5024]ETK33779.1 hypothetical protein MPTA5024_22855 [Microbispora sp. ATCC PTA-5024]